jgi:DNA-directed RNA polymerase specialized sigma24 family protein
MNKEMSKALTALGAALLRSYKEEWEPKLKLIDRFAEDVVSIGSWNFAGKVQGGEPLHQPELFMIVKENSRDYREVSAKIEKLEKILSTLSEEEISIIEFYHWKGIEVSEIAKIVHMEPRSVYRRIRTSELKVGSRGQRYKFMKVVID